jgi:hypothetical protein
MFSIVGWIYCWWYCSSRIIHVKKTTLRVVALLEMRIATAGVYASSVVPHLRISTY